MYSLYPLIGRYLSGTAASGLFEARLGREAFGGEVHVFAAPLTARMNSRILRPMQTTLSSTPLPAGEIP
jgi:hypothetical protein